MMRKTPLQISRIVIISLFLIPLLIAGYFFVDIFAWWQLARLDILNDPNAKNLFVIQSGIYKIGFASVFCGFYGFFHFHLRHPMWIPKYESWLQTTLWNSRLPLPMGSVSLTTLDTIVLSGIAIFVHYTCIYSAAYPLIFFGIGYLLDAAATFWASTKSATLFILIVFAGAIRFGQFPWFALGLIGTAFLVAHQALPASFDKVSWIGQLGPRNLRRMQLGWPLDFIGPAKPARQWAFSGKIGAATLAAWWTYSIVYQIELRDPELNTKLFTLLTIVADLIALNRLFVYCMGYFWPFSLAGRVACRQWIFPAYDQVFIAPICILITGLVLGVFAVPRFSSPAVYLAFASFVLISMRLGMRPSLETWRLTGGHRIVSIDVPTGSGKKKQQWARTSA